MFKKKRLKKTKRVCIRLKEARERAGLSLSELSRLTKISSPHLKAIEECKFNQIPYAQVYQKNFIREFAKAVDVSYNDLLKQFEKEEAQATLPNTTNNKVRGHEFRNFPGIVKAVGLSLIVLTLIGYLGWQVRAIVRPPELTVLSPRDGHITETASVIVHGLSSKQAQVYINGQKITTDSSGKFEEALNLSTGINTLIISAKKKHGKSTELTRHVIVKDAPKFSLTI